VAPQDSQICGGNLNRLVTCKAHYSPLTDGENTVQIDVIGDAVLPQTDKKMTRKCGSEFGGLLWCHLTPQRKTAI